VVGGAAANGALAEGGEWSGPKGETVAWALAGAVGFGGMTAGVARLAPDLGPWACTPVVWAAQWVVLAPLVLRSPRAFAPPPRWRNVAGMAVLESLGFFCFTLATRLAPLAVVGPPASISTPLTVLWARMVLGERVGPARAVCVGLAVVGTVIISRA
jgi:drug/metabolite transporter (DMT)-like permease